MSSKEAFNWRSVTMANLTEYAFAAESDAINKRGIFQDDPAQNFPLSIPNQDKQNDNAGDLKKKQMITMNGHNNYLAQQIFHLYCEQQLNRLMLNQKFLQKLSSMNYVISPGIGAHKLYKDIVNWNSARQSCIKDGGHLAIINSEAEEKLLFRLLQDQNLKRGWLGFHDLYEEGDWVTVLDEPLASLGYVKWTNRFANLPDNGGGHRRNQDCAVLMEGGMDDQWCDGFTHFFCEIKL